MIIRDFNLSLNGEHSSIEKINNVTLTVKFSDFTVCDFIIGEDEDYYEKMATYSLMNEKNSLYNEVKEYFKNMFMSVVNGENFTPNTPVGLIGLEDNEIDFYLVGYSIKKGQISDLKIYSNQNTYFLFDMSNAKNFEEVKNFLEVLNSDIVYLVKTHFDDDY